MPPAEDPSNTPQREPDEPRAVAIERAFAWYATALKTFKRSPFVWCSLALITLLAEILQMLIPGIGSAISEVLTPVIASGMLIGARALDQGEKLTIAHSFAAFRAPARALACIIVSALIDAAWEVDRLYCPAPRA